MKIIEIQEHRGKSPGSSWDFYSLLEPPETVPPRPSGRHPGCLPSARPPDARAPGVSETMAHGGAKSTPGRSKFVPRGSEAAFRKPPGASWAQGGPKVAASGGPKKTGARLAALGAVLCRSWRLFGRFGPPWGPLEAPREALGCRLGRYFWRSGSVASTSQISCCFLMFFVSCFGIVVCLRFPSLRRARRPSGL